MSIAQGIGPSDRVGLYRVPDGEMSAGSTLGAPKVCAVIKATGAIEKVYSVDWGWNVFGTVVLHHWDDETGAHLTPRAGDFLLHPEHQERRFTLSNGVHVHEDIFVLNGPPGEDGGDEVDPPAAYYTVRLRNDTDETARIASYAFCQLGGETTDVATRAFTVTYDEGLQALVAWSDQEPDQVHVFGCSARPASVATALDHGRGVAETCPGALPGPAEVTTTTPVGAVHLVHTLRPGDEASFTYLLSFAAGGREGAARVYHSCPSAEEALARTTEHYHDVLSRATLLTPNAEINRGVLWAKANMLRSELKPPTGWGLTNNPTKSSKAVARDSAWFAFGADYITPRFARASLLAFTRNQRDNGLIVEDYDMRTGETHDLGFNINDDTPLLILALWRHYTIAGDDDFLREVYPCVAKAARRILSQRNDQGLVWCDADGTGGQGIIGWRNALQGYRLSGATTEVNAECFAALDRASTMARIMGAREEADLFARAASDLKDAINTHLYNPDNGLYYLNIDVDGRPRGDVTSDLVFPAMFGVADDETTARIVKRLSSADFWTLGGIRVVPRDAPDYSPDQGSGLLGGVWAGSAFWFAFAAARFSPAFVADALGACFENYARDPRKNNTVPGQFSEWLHGETLVNEGMMLSPWFPPRYLWAAIEGAAGFDADADGARLSPRLAPDWAWMGVRALPYRGRSLTWLVARMPEQRLYTTYAFDEAPPASLYQEDISASVRADGDGDQAVTLGLRRGDGLLIFAGNTSDCTITITLRLDDPPAGAYRLRAYDSMTRRWADDEPADADRLRRGVMARIERKGFYLIEAAREG